MESDSSMIPSKARLLAHAQDYRDRAKALKNTQPAWITDGIEVRTREYEELAEYFVKLANRDEVPVVQGWDFGNDEPVVAFL